MDVQLLVRPRAAAGSIKAWAGLDENVAKGQAVYLHRARMNGLAAKGAWTQAAEG